MRNNAGRIKSDCRKIMAGAIWVSFFHRLVTVAAPTIAAWLMGSMTNSLMTLNKSAILSGLPGFLAAVALQVFGVALLRLELNLLLTRRDFAYDSFLMEKYIHLPLSAAESVDSGMLMERLGDDAAAFCWNQMTVCAYPGAVALYAGVLIWTFCAQGTHWIYGATIVLLAAVPVLRTAFIGKTQTEIRQRTSEYNETRKELEQELFSARDFSKSYGLKAYLVGRLENAFRGYLKNTGSAEYRMQGRTEILDFVCQHGIQLAAVLLGTYLISLGKLTMGSLISGYLMIPAITQCLKYASNWIGEKHDEKKYVERLNLFYAAPGEPEAEEKTLRVLEAEKITFSYNGEKTPVLKNLDFRMTAEENWRLAGENGSGKSTLLSILAGLYEPQTGRVCGGASPATRRKNVSVQEQDGAVFSGTFWENLFLPEEKRGCAQALLQEMGMTKPLDYAVEAGGENLSPGERKKLLLTRALLRDSGFLLLDEPANHLDAGAKAVLHRELEKRTGVLLISHQEDVCQGLHLKTLNLEKVQQG